MPCGAPKDEEEGLCGALLRHGTTLAWFTGLHLIHPGYPLRRGISAAAVDRDIGSLYPVQVAHPQFRMLFCCLCSALYRSRFSRVVRLMSFVFHWWGGRSFVPAAAFGTGSGRAFFIGGGGAVCSCGYVWFCRGLSLGLPLTASFLPISLDASPFHQLCRVQKCRKKCVCAACTVRKQVFHTV